MVQYILGEGTEVLAVPHVKASESSQFPIATCFPGRQEMWQGLRPTGGLPGPSRTVGSVMLCLPTSVTTEPCVVEASQGTTVLQNPFCKALDQSAFHGGEGGAQSVFC